MECIKVTLLTEKEMAMVLFNGTTGRNFKVTGKMEWNLALEYGDHLKEILMKGSGVITDNMAKEYSNTKTVHTKANIKTS